MLTRKTTTKLANNPCDQEPFDDDHTKGFEELLDGLNDAPSDQPDEAHQSPAPKGARVEVETNPLRHPRVDFSRVPGHSKRGGGPRSPQGKARASQNATKHGGYVLPQADNALLARIEQGLRNQYRVQTDHQRLLVEQLAQAFWSLALMGGIMQENLALAFGWEPSPQALCARVNFPWPGHAHELSSAPTPLALQRELGRLFQRLLNTLGAPGSQHPKGAATYKLVHQAAQRFQSGAPLMEHDAPEFWPRLDRLMARAQPVAPARTEAEALTAPSSSSTPLRLVAHLPDTRAIVTSPSRQRPQLLTQPADAAAPDLEALARTYWIFRNHRRLQHERNMMVNERRMAMLSDVCVARAQAIHLKRIDMIERQLLEAELSPTQRAALRKRH